MRLCVGLFQFDNHAAKVGNDCRLFFTGPDALASVSGLFCAPPTTLTLEPRIAASAAPSILAGHSWNESRLIVARQINQSRTAIVLMNTIGVMPFGRNQSRTTWITQSKENLSAQPKASLSPIATQFTIARPNYIAPAMVETLPKADMPVSIYKNATAIVLLNPILSMPSRKNQNAAILEMPTLVEMPRFIHMADHRGDAHQFRIVGHTLPARQYSLQTVRDCGRINKHAGGHVCRATQRFTAASFFQNERLF